MSQVTAVVRTDSKPYHNKHIREHCQVVGCRCTFRSSRRADSCLPETSRSEVPSLTRSVADSLAGASTDAARAATLLRDGPLHAWAALRECVASARAFMTATFGRNLFLCVARVDHHYRFLEVLASAQLQTFGPYV